MENSIGQITTPYQLPIAMLRKARVNSYKWKILEGYLLEGVGQMIMRVWRGDTEDE